MYCNLRKAKRRWSMVAKVLVNVGVNVRAQEIVYNVVVQMIFIYGRNSWAVTYYMLKVLEGFQNIVSWMIAGMTSCQFGEGGGSFHR